MKFLILGFLIFIFYRMVVKPKSIDSPPQKPPIQDSESEGFVDYEEVE